MRARLAVLLYRLGLGTLAMLIDHKAVFNEIFRRFAEVMERNSRAIEALRESIDRIDLTPPLDPYQLDLIERASQGPNGEGWTR